MIIYTGKETVSDNSDHVFEGLDEGKRISVTITKEAIEDYGLMAGKQKGIDKYNRSESLLDGNILVTTKDFQ